MCLFSHLILALAVPWGKPCVKGNKCHKWDTVMILVQKAHVSSPFLMTKQVQQNLKLVIRNGRGCFVKHHS